MKEEIKNNNNVLKTKEKPIKIRKRKILLGSLGALAFMTVLGTASLAYAVSPETNKDSSILDRVAQIVGIDSTKLKDAFSQVSTQDVDQMLKDEKITQTQADHMKEKIKSGEYLGGMHQDSPIEGMKGGVLRDSYKDIAAWVGLSETDFFAKHYDQSKSLLTIATEQGKSEADLKNFLSELLDKNLAQAVADGKITQVRADQMKENKDNMIDEMMNHTGFGGGKMRGMMEGKGKKEGLFKMHKNNLKSEVEDNN